MTASKVYLVLWSGGFDSTYLIQRLLEQGHTVWAGYVDLQNNPDKTAYELQAIEKLTPVLKCRHFSSFYYLGTILSMDIKRPDAVYCLPQVGAWIMAAAACCPERVDSIALGYVMNDDAISFLGEIKEVFEAYCKMSDGRKTPTMEFPLSKTKKSELLERISPDLKALCVCCERPIKSGKTFRRCQKCPSCKRHAQESSKPQTKRSTERAN